MCAGPVIGRRDETDGMQTRNISDGEAALDPEGRYSSS